MRKIVSLLIMSLCVAALSMSQSSQMRQIGSYNTISVFGSIDLLIAKGISDSVKIVSDSVLFNKVSVKVEDGVLRILATDKLFSKYRNVTVYLPYNVLKKVDARAGAFVSSKEPLNVDSLNLSAESGAVVKFTVTANYIKSYVGNGATITLDGTCISQVAKTGSGGIFNAYYLQSETAEANATMGGITKIAASKKLDASVSMGGSVSYRGIPKNKKEHKTLGGSIEQVQE